MKTTKVLLSAASAIMAALLLTACSSDTELTDEEVERGMVKTEFTISFPQKATGLTRMSAANVQLPGTGNQVSFRGIKNIELYPFSLQASSVNGTIPVPTPITLYGSGTASKAGYSGADNAIASSGALYEASNSHLYQNVDIAIGTQSFMFYGEAATTNSQTAKEVGALEKSPAGPKLADIRFTPKSIFSATSVGSNGQKVAEYLTSIADAKVDDTKTWQATTNVGLQTLYENFTSIKTGAWANVKALVQQVWTNLAARAEDNNETKAMKTAIRTAIVNSSYGVSESGGKLSFSQNMADYPADLGLPDGAAYVNWQTDANGKKAFVPLTNNGNTGMNISSMSSYVFPASLYYRVLSDIVTSEEPKEAFNDTDTWTNITSGYTSGNKVTSRTRSLAIKDAVQYAVGRLDVTVVANNSSLQDRASKTFTLNANTFPVSAILVGGQKAVDYKFEQVADNGAAVYTIYDPLIAESGRSIALTSKPSDVMRTLVLETKAATATKQDDAVVKIAVEFTNNTEDIITGQGGQLIYPHCKFYLIGTLDPFDTSSKTTNTTGQKKAFLQDYVTTANLTIKSLKSAYNTLPDLTVPKLEMGVSVDLSWKTGITQTVEIE